MKNIGITRAVHFCRVLGNPGAYGIVRLLAKRRLRPMQMSKMLGIERTAISNQLERLKLIGLVDCNSTGIRGEGRKVEYWLVDRRIGRLILKLEKYLTAQKR